VRKLEQRALLVEVRILVLAQAEQLFSVVRLEALGNAVAFGGGDGLKLAGRQIEADS